MLSSLVACSALRLPTQTSGTHRFFPQASSTRRVFISTAAAASAGAIAQPAHAAKNRDDGYDVRKTAEQWQTELTDYQYFVLRNGGTEPPNTSPLYKEKRAGVFRCAVPSCDLPLFEASAKFESGTGWPSYAKPIDGAVEVMSAGGFLGGLQTAALGSECRCTKCGGHLGDVFLDGILFPGTMAALTGKRYCIDGTSLAFEPAGSPSGTRVSGESKQYSKPADVELPSWLQPPPVSRPA